MASLSASQNLLGKNSTPVVIRSALDNDAEDLLFVSKSVIDEKIYQLMTSEEFTVDVAEEIKWIHSFRDKPNSLLLVAEVNQRVVGLLDFHGGRRQRISHVGDFAISILAPFRNLGIGSMLIRNMINWAHTTRKIEKINLQVHSTNQQAIQTYLKNGFVIEGVRKKELKYVDGSYVDAVLMARFIE